MRTTPEDRNKYFTNGRYLDYKVKLIYGMLASYMIASGFFLTYFWITSNYRGLPYMILIAIIMGFFLIVFIDLFRYAIDLKIDKGNMMVHLGRWHVPLSDIKFAKVTGFYGGNIKLYVGFVDKNGKPRIKITLGTEEFDLMEFCNILRGMKGWPRQELVEWPDKGYFEWKKDVEELIKRRDEEGPLLEG